ncbi:MAG: glycosyl transferase [Cycloclasticus sp.]|nr:glycosyl transferase [Cycloclasticus sp.]MBG96144.1 glycosyl transferase [Cycloclasticus sp.]HAI96659.1 glycosyl transferase [Methylococcaceae bacterium]
MKVTVITVCYNAAEFIRSAIESVLLQDYDNVEYLLIDGGSSDSTIRVINEYKERITAVVSEPDQGIYDAINKGLALATGDVIAILNSDDFYLHAHVISDVVKVLHNNKNVDLLLGNVDFITPEKVGRSIRYYSSFRFEPWKMRFGFMPAHSAAFIKSSAYHQIGTYKLHYRIAADFDMFVRMLVVGKLPYFKMNKTLVRMRIGGVSTAGVKSYITSTKEMLYSLRENNIYSNYLMILLRLPIKFFQMLLFRLKTR